MPDFSIYRGLPIHSLSLAHNRICIIPPGFLDGIVFSSAYKGQDPKLDLTKNPIGQSLSDESFRGIQADSLELQLVTTSLTSVPKVALSKMENWTLLSLGDNLIPSVEEGDFENLTKVRNIDLSDNPITEVHEDAFLGVEESLENMNLSNTQLNDVPTAALRPLQVLSLLDLEGCHIQEIKDEAFGQFATEQPFTLKLDNNEIKEFSSTAFKGAKFQLRTFNLQKNSVSHLEVLYDFCAHVFASSPKILLQENPIDCNCDVFLAKKSGRVDLEGTCGEGNSYASMDLGKEFTDMAAQECTTSIINTRCNKGDPVSFISVCVVILFAMWAVAAAI